MSAYKELKLEVYESSLDWDDKEEIVGIMESCDDNELQDVCEAVKDVLKGINNNYAKYKEGRNEARESNKKAKKYNDELGAGLTYLDARYNQDIKDENRAKYYADSMTRRAYKKANRVGLVGAGVAGAGAASAVKNIKKIKELKDEIKKLESMMKNEDDKNQRESIKEDIDTLKEHIATLKKKSVASGTAAGFGAGLTYGLLHNKKKYHRAMEDDYRRQAEE